MRKARFSASSRLAMNCRLVRTNWPSGGESQGNGFFLPLETAVLAAAPKVSTWATGQDYAPAAVNTFLQVADYWLVAFAAAHQHTVVTHELPANSAKKIKIPNACVGLGVRFMTPYQMLRVERARFVLAPSSSTDSA